MPKRNDFEIALDFFINDQFKEARKYFERATETIQGQLIQEAAYHLGHMYLHGLGGDVDKPKAYYWFEYAASHGHVLSKYNVGVMHNKGLGVEQSLAKALGWWEDGVKHGSAESMHALFLRLARFVKKRTPDQTQRMFELGTMAAKKGHSHARILLAEVIKENQGKFDLPEATKEWYQHWLDHPVIDIPSPQSSELNLKERLKKIKNDMQSVREGSMTAESVRRLPSKRPAEPQPLNPYVEPVGTVILLFLILWAIKALYQSCKKKNTKHQRRFHRSSQYGQKKSAPMQLELIPFSLKTLFERCHPSLFLGLSVSAKEKLLAMGVVLKHGAIEAKSQFYSAITRLPLLWDAKGTKSQEIAVERKALKTTETEKTSKPKVRKVAKKGEAKKIKKNKKRKPIKKSDFEKSITAEAKKTVDVKTKEVVEERAEKIGVVDAGKGAKTKAKKSMEVNVAKVIEAHAGKRTTEKVEKVARSEPAASVIKAEQKKPAVDEKVALGESVGKMFIPKPVKKIMHAFESDGVKIYLVGGAVRDWAIKEIWGKKKALKKKPKDYDLVVWAPKEKVTKKLSSLHVKAKVSKYFSKYGEGELFSFVHEKIEVQIVCRQVSLSVDLGNRDFGINTFVSDSLGFVYDPLGIAMRDVKAQRIKTICAAQESYKSDPIRMLRGIRFTAEVAFPFPKNEEKKMPLQLLTEKVSPSRLFYELGKCILHPKGHSIYTELRGIGVIAQLFMRANAFLNKGVSCHYRKFLTETLKQASKLSMPKDLVFMHYFFAVIYLGQVLYFYSGELDSSELEYLRKQAKMLENASEIKVGFYPYADPRQRARFQILVLKAIEEYKNLLLESSPVKMSVGFRPGLFRTLNTKAKRTNDVVGAKTGGNNGVSIGEYSLKKPVKKAPALAWSEVAAGKFSP